jgi:formylglycine-generating enzyme required for sulfatase activity
VACDSLVLAAPADVFNMGAGLTSLETVPVGNVDNSADTTGYGAVDYAYNIGRYEVTAGQYAEFLNAVAETDPYGLYSTSMWSSGTGCKIQRSGSSGGYSYSVDPNRANRPVNYVSWGDAARFANWLHNGQPTGAQDANTTEDGAYALNGATAAADLQLVGREADWQWAITTENEWYKAAYHANDGNTHNYFDCPTANDTTPDNDLIDPDPGNNATFYDGGYTIGGPHYRTEAGAHEESNSPYGTFDQGGNVWEWNEAILYGSYRGLRGSSFSDIGDYLKASNRDAYDYPTAGTDTYGFRVSQVPEPASAALAALAGAVVLMRRRRARG